MRAAIYFQPEAFNASGRKVMGRNAAGASFLRGFAAQRNCGRSLTGKRMRRPSRSGCVSTAEPMRSRSSTAATSTLSSSRSLAWLVKVDVLRLCR